MWPYTFRMLASLVTSLTKHHTVMRVLLLVLPALFIIMATTAFDNSLLKDPTDVSGPQSHTNNDLCVSSAVQTNAVPIQMLTKKRNALGLVESAPSVIPVCVLPGDSSSNQQQNFAKCIANTDCGNWTRYEDEDNGNVAMICHGNGA